uniref:Putative secreted protein n=1 Tax=Ixodes ricinus TaxID=34613 RepID=A0A147BKB9_IXORI
MSSSTLACSLFMVVMSRKTPTWCPPTITSHRRCHASTALLPLEIRSERQFNLLILVPLQNELNRLVSVESDLAEKEQVVVTKRVISFSHGFQRYVFSAC